MLRLFKKFTKVVPGQATQVSYGSTNSTSVAQTPAVLTGSPLDPSTEVTTRHPGYVRVFGSWLPTGGGWNFQERLHSLMNRGQRGNDPWQQWQSQRGQQYSEFEALGLGTAVVVAIQLCRALSVARIPDQETVPRPAFLRTAHLYPGPSTTQGVLSQDSSSDGSTVSNSSSVVDDPLSAVDDPLSSCLPTEDSESFKDGVTCSPGVTLPENSTVDNVIDAIESAMSRVNQAHLLTQGMAHTMMGVQYANLGCYKKAVEHFEAASQTGYSKAQFNLGLCFELGKGVQADAFQAAYLYQQAADQGHPLALYNLGVYCYHGYGGLPQDQSVALKYMEEAADAGVIHAHSFLGNHYLHAESREVHKAVFHLKRAVKEQDTEAEYLLGLCYEQGWGVRQSRSRAAILYHKAAEKGHSLAMYSLGLYYEKEIGGLIRDEDHAIRLYTSASEQGLQLATDRLQSLTSNPEIDLQEALPPLNTSGNSSGPSNTPLQLGAKVKIFHTSASEPSLHERDRAAHQTKGNLLQQLSYLSLILPSLLHGTGKQQGPTDCGDSEVIEDDRLQQVVKFQVGGDGETTRWAGEHAESLQVVM